MIDTYLLFAFVFGCRGGSRFLLTAAAFVEVVMQIVRLLFVSLRLFVHTAKFDLSNIIRLFAR